jgi:hypothetical protein
VRKEMRKWLAIAVVGAILVTMAMPFLASAATSVNIAITATGSEINITCNQTSWDAGTLSASETNETAINWGQVENDGGSEAVDISIHGHDMTGGVVTWTLADDGNAGAATIGMKAGLDDADDLFDIVIKKTAAFNLLVDELATDATADFGLKLWAPTSGVGNEAMTMESSGLTLTGSID